MLSDDRAIERQISEVLSQRTGTLAADWHCVFKARYGMHVAFEAIRECMGEGEVATQLLTCCTAVDPILSADLTPRYCDISPRTASIDPLRLDLSGSVRAVVLQHTYGIIDDASSRELARCAHESGAVVIEDCAHCVGRMALDEEGRPLADISVHSFGIEKVLDTLMGGAIWVNPASPFSELVAEVSRRLAELPPAPVRIKMLSRMNRFQLRVFGHLPHDIHVRWYRRLSSHGLFEPAVAEEERRGRLPYDPMRPSAYVCKKALSALKGIEGIEASKRELVSIYRRGLSGVEGIEIPAAAMEGEAQPLLKFPLLVHDTALADCVVEAVCDAGYFTSAWYRPELYPNVLDKEAYHVPTDRSNLMENDRFIARVATLPTNITPDAAQRVVEVVLGVVSS